MILHGSIRLTKRLRRHPVWKAEPKCYAAAWCDLVLLANDQDRTARLRGESLELKRGQLAWSLRGLEEEWGRSIEWIRKFLKFCQDNSMIKVDANPRRSIITILNYDVYNPVEDTDPHTEQHAEPDTDPHTEQHAEPHRNMEQGMGNREIGTGKGLKPSFSGKGPSPAATSPAQALFLVDRELAEVSGDIATLDDLVQPVPRELRERKRVLEKKRAGILAQGGGR